MGIGSNVLSGTTLNSSVLGGGSSAGSSYSTDAQQFFDRITDPGTTRKDLYAAMIDGLVSDGVWSKLDALWIMAADIAGNAVVNLVSSSYGLTNHSASFTADRGYTGNGSTAYIDTGFNPSTAGGHFTQNAAHFSAWDRTNRATATESLGGIIDISGGYETNIFPFYTSALVYNVNYSYGGRTTATSAASNGFYTVTRTASDHTESYKNGSSAGSGAGDSFALFNANLYLLAVNGSGDGLFYVTSDQIAAASVGGTLTATDAGNLYTRISTYMTAVGA